MWQFVAAAVVAGASAAGASQANKSDKYSAKLTGIQNDINAARAKENAAIDAYNLREDLKSLESSQRVVAAAQGKRIDPGSSIDVMQKRQRGLLERDVKQLYRGAELTAKFGEIGTTAAKTAASERSNQRWTSWVSSMGMTMGKAFE